MSEGLLAGQSPAPPAGQSPAPPETSFPVRSDGSAADAHMPSRYGGPVSGDSPPPSRDGGPVSGDSPPEDVFGADKAGRTLTMPKDGEDVEALNKIYAALGRPENAEGYGFDEMFKGRAVDQNFVDVISSAMHEAGLSKAQAARLATAYNGLYDSTMEAYEARCKSEQTAFAKSVDPEKLETARRGFRLFGLPADEGDAVSRSIEQALGLERAVDLFASLGRKLGEDRMPAGESVLPPASPAGAERRMTEKMNDKLFMDRYLAGDKHALAEMEELAKMAASRR